MPLIPFGYKDNSLESFRDSLPTSFLSHLMVLIEPLDQALEGQNVYCKASGMGKCLLLMPQSKTVPSAPIWLKREFDVDDGFEVLGNRVSYQNLDVESAVEKTLRLIETCGSWPSL